MSNKQADYFEIFPWDRNFETGIEIIDQQHQKLVAILNNLAYHLANRSQPESLLQILDELTDYTHYHFETEEKIWHQHMDGDEWLDSHEDTHHAFIHKIAALRTEQNTESIDDLLQHAFSFLSHWLAYHILDTDKRMAKTVLLIKKGHSIEQAKAGANEAMTGSMKVLIDTVLNMYDSLSDRTMALMRERAQRIKAEKALLDSEQRWKFILEAGSESIWDWDINNNTASSSEKSEDPFDLLQASINANYSSIHPADIDQFKRDLEEHICGNSEFFVNKHRVVHGPGNWTWVTTRGKVVSRDAQGRPLRMIGTHNDVTERELASMIFYHTSQAMLITDKDNRIISVNPAFTKTTGYSRQQVLGKDPKLLASGRHDKDFYRSFWEAINTSDGWQGEIWNRRQDGKIFPEELIINTIKDEQGNIDHHIALFNDITEKKLATEIILEQANMDPLTKLPNRRMFFDRLEHTIQRAMRNQHTFAVLYIDLDSFKEINDSLGHNIGDILLMQVGQRLAKLVRASDTISRIGGDEFTIIIDDLTDIDISNVIARKIIDSMKAPFTISEQDCYISSSIGITVFPEDGNNATQLLKNADQAMYEAKKSGRNCYRYFTTALQRNIELRQRIKNNLYIALSENQFRVHYQPIIHLQTGKINKAEALIRWQQPDQGEIAPSRFIPIAEESGLIHEIGDWVFDTVIQQLLRWKQSINPSFKISINKSPVQFRFDANHLSKTVKKLQDADINGHNLVFEITEGMLMESDPHAIQQMLELRDLGVELALDDFGTGYSSMSYLQRFDIDFIKIDQSFVSHLNENNSDTALCEAMIAMAHKLGLEVIAEGIETETQLQILTRMGCDYGQGYYFSPALPAAGFEVFINNFQLCAGKPRHYFQ